MSARHLTKYQVGLILELLDDGIVNSERIGNKLGITKYQVAAVKAWRTMGKY